MSNSDFEGSRGVAASPLWFLLPPATPIQGLKRQVGEASVSEPIAESRARVGRGRAGDLMQAFGSWKLWRQRDMGRGGLLHVATAMLSSSMFCESGKGPWWACVRTSPNLWGNVLTLFHTQAERCGWLPLRTGWVL